jgi:hypothetical protein
VITRSKNGIDRRCRPARAARIDLGDQQGVAGRARDDGIERVLGDVVVARQRQLVLPSVGHFLHDRIRRALRHGIGDVRVVEAGVARCACVEPSSAPDCM